jgi:hypothetical protein
MGHGPIRHFFPFPELFLQVAALHAGEFAQKINKNQSVTESMLWHRFCNSITNAEYRDYASVAQTE